MSITIYHNPRCSKSRATLALIEESGIQPEINEYLKNSFTIEQLQQIAHALKLSDVRDMMRRKDALYKELHLDNPALSQEELVKILADNISLLERPIVVKDDNAVIGRPPENVFNLIGII